MISALLQPFRFILVGTVNTLIGLSVIFAAKGIAGLDGFCIQPARVQRWIID